MGIWAEFQGQRPIFCLFVQVCCRGEMLAGAHKITYHEETDAKIAVAYQPGGACPRCPSKGEELAGDLDANAMLSVRHAIDPLPIKRGE